MSKKRNTLKMEFIGDDALKIEEYGTSQFRIFEFKGDEKCEVGIYDNIATTESVFEELLKELKTNYLIDNKITILEVIDTGCTEFESYEELIVASISNGFQEIERIVNWNEEE